MGRKHRNCLVKACDGKIEAGDHGMCCQVCWKRLPAHLKNQVAASFRRGKKDQISKAVSRAFDWLNDHPAPCGSAV